MEYTFYIYMLTANVGGNRDAQFRGKYVIAIFNVIGFSIYSKIIMVQIFFRMSGPQNVFSECYDDTLLELAYVDIIRVRIAVNSDKLCSPYREGFFAKLSPTFPRLSHIALVAFELWKWQRTPFSSEGSEKDRRVTSERSDI